MCEGRKNQWREKKKQKGNDEGPRDILLVCLVQTVYWWLHTGCIGALKTSSAKCILLPGRLSWQSIWVA